MVPRLAAVYLAVALAAAAASGALAAVAIVGTAKQTPVTTTTVTIPTPSTVTGETTCPAGSKFGELVIDHPGGQVSILTCIVG